MISRKKRLPTPDVEILNAVAKALGETVEVTDKRGPKVAQFIYDLIETNAYENRKRLPSICARIEISSLMLHTTFRSETDDYLDDNKPAAEHVLGRLRELQESLDSLRVRCERTVRNAANLLGT